MSGSQPVFPPARGGGHAIFIASSPQQAAAAVGALRATGWLALETLSSAPPEGQPRAGWVQGALGAVELAHHWLFARSVLPSPDVLVIVDCGDEDAASSLAELVRDARVSRLTDAISALSLDVCGDPPPSPVILDQAELFVLDRLHDPAALALAAEQSGERGWILRPSTLLELRERRLLAAGVPRQDPSWGEGGAAWWRHNDSARAAAMLEDLLTRAEHHGWPNASRLRLMLGVCRLLFADAALSLGLLERALVELRTEPSNDDEILARLGLVIAMDRLGQDNRPLMRETVARAGAHISPRLRAQTLDALAAAHHRAGRIDEALDCFRRGAGLAEDGGAPRFQALLLARVLEVGITSGRTDPDLDEIRALRRRVAQVGGVRSAMMVLQLLGDVARRLGALDEAAEAYSALAALQPLAPAALGHAMIALEREDYETAATLLVEARSSREPTGRRPTVLIEAVSLPLYEHRGELERWEAALEAWPLSVRGGHIDAARAAESAARLAWGKWEPAAGARAARATRLAMAHWRALGRPERALELRQQAVQMWQVGWPVPLGPLDLLASVAKGGTSFVWRARHRELDLEVAVKVLAADEARDSSAISALDAEVKATARLRHPHIVAVRDLGVVDDLAHALGGAHLPEGSPFVALEWVPGGTLGQRIGHRSAAPLRWEACRAVLDQVLDALAHAHGHGLVHRDIKPDNVMWAGEERGLPVVKLVDFGLAGVGGDLISGTPLYMAPEQFRGHGVGPWTDLYAVGCLAVALVQGRPPYSGRNLRALQDAHTLSPLPVVEARIPVPTTFAEWLEGLLAKEPSHRFPTAGAARYALAALGPPGSYTVAPQVAVVEEDNRTIVFADLDAPSPAPPSEPRAERPLAPVPVWSGRAIPAFPRPLGRALGGLGSAPLLGRADAYAALWRALQQAGLGASGTVVVCGAPGLGVSHLLYCFGREVRAAGCAVVLDGLFQLAERARWSQRPALTLVIADEPEQSEAELDLLLAPVEQPSPLLLVVGTRDPMVAARWVGRGAALCTLERLDLEQLVVLARDLVPLRGDAALSLAAQADGNPGVLSRTISNGLDLGAFLPARGGLVIRPGVHLVARGLTQIRRVVLDGRNLQERRALCAVAILAEQPEAIAAAWALLSLQAAAAAVGDALELVEGRLRLRLPGAVPALLQEPVDQALLLACVEALSPIPGPAALALRASLLVRAGRVGEGVDAMAELAWGWPGDAGELRLLDLVRLATDALAASGAGGRDARWGRLALVEVRAAILGADPQRAEEAARQAEETDLPEASAVLPYLRAIIASLGGRPQEAIARLAEAMKTERIAEDPALRLRYSILSATFSRDWTGLMTAAQEADALGLHRLAGDAWRGAARVSPRTESTDAIRVTLSRAIVAYGRANSAYGVATAVDERGTLRLRSGDIAGFVEDAEEVSGALVAFLGEISVLVWLDLAVARLLSGRLVEAADGLAAASALGLDRLPTARQLAGLLATVFAADGPSVAWLHARRLLGESLRAPDDPLPAVLLGLAIDRAASAGLTERCSQLVALRRGGCPH